MYRRKQRYHSAHPLHVVLGRNIQQHVNRNVVAGAENARSEMLGWERTDNMTGQLPSAFIYG